MYRHTQIGWMTLIGLIVGLAVLAAIYGTMGQNSAGGRPAMLATMILLAAMVPLMTTLTVTVDAEAVRAGFGIGLIRRRIPLGNIQAATQVRNRWWYGWGIRAIGRGGWMYNVSGLDAVEIRLKNGGRFRIGTDEPEELLNAIREKMQAARQVENRNNKG